MEWNEYLYSGAFLAASSFPIFYIFYKKGRNKIFYLGSCIGVINLLIITVSIAAAPIALFLIKVAPQLAEFGYVDNILVLLHLSEITQQYYYLVLYPVLSLTIPLLLYKRYSIFHLTKQSSGLQ